MADINWDSSIPNPSTWTFGIIQNVFARRNPYTGATRTLGIPGARWWFRAQWNMLGRGQGGDALRALLLRLRGGANRLLMYDLAQPNFRGAGGGSPVVNGAGQTGGVLAISGCTPNVTNWALPGDKFSVGGELKMVVAPANTNASGQTTLTFEPVLRSSPANGAALIISSPTAKFMLRQPIVGWTYETIITTSVEIEGEEVFL